MQTSPQIPRRSLLDDAPRPLFLIALGFGVAALGARINPHVASDALWFGGLTFGIGLGAILILHTVRHFLMAWQEYEIRAAELVRLQNATVPEEHWHNQEAITLKFISAVIDYADEHNNEIPPVRIMLKQFPLAGVWLKRMADDGFIEGRTERGDGGTWSNAPDKTGVNAMKFYSV